VILDRPAAAWPLAPGARPQIELLAERLTSLHVRRIVTSPERKAIETGEILAARLGLAVEVRDGFEEHRRLVGDRPADPGMFRRNMAEFFRCPNEIVFGVESAAMACERFRGAVHRLMDESHDDELVVSHGAVISLLAARGNPDAAWTIWSSLGLPDHTPLAWPALVRVLA
jgi:broad specificity phosphatase PhoE